MSISPTITKKILYYLILKVFVTKSICAFFCTSVEKMAYACVCVCVCVLCIVNMYVRKKAARYRYTIDFNCKINYRQ